MQSWCRAWVPRGKLGEEGVAANGQLGKALAARPWAKSSSRARMTCGRVTTGRGERMMAFGRKKGRGQAVQLYVPRWCLWFPDQRPWRVMSQPPNAAAIGDLGQPVQKEASTPWSGGRARRNTEQRDSRRLARCSVVSDGRTAVRLEDARRLRLTG